MLLSKSHLGNLDTTEKKNSYNATLVKQKTHSRVFLPQSRWPTLSTFYTFNESRTVLPAQYRFTLHANILHTVRTTMTAKGVVFHSRNPRQPRLIGLGFWLWGRPSGVEETAGAGSALPAVTWAPPRSVFNRLREAHHYHGQTNLPFVPSRHISKHDCDNYFTAVPCLHRSLLLREKCGKRRDNIYLSVDLKLIMILNWCSCSPWSQFNVFVCVWVWKACCILHKRYSFSLINYMEKFTFLKFKK